MLGWLKSRKEREAEEARRRAQRAIPAPSRAASDYSNGGLLDPLNVASPLSPLNPVHYSPPSHDSSPSYSHSSHDSGGYSGGYSGGSDSGGSSGGGCD